MSTAAVGNKLRLLCLTRAWRENAGGMERLSWELTHELGKDKDIAVTIIAHRGSRATSPLFIFTCLPRALSAARQADVIHLGDPMLSFIGWLIKLIFKKPVAVTVHGLDVTYPNPLYQLYLKLFFGGFDLYLPISKYVAGLTEKCIAPSAATPTRLSGLWRLSAWSPPKRLRIRRGDSRNPSEPPAGAARMSETGGGWKARIKVINPGIYDQYYDPSISRQDLDTLLGLNTADNVVLFTSGRLAARKGHVWFIGNVLPHLPKNVWYVIAGQGRQAAALTAAAQAATVAPQVKLLGRVGAADLKILYNSADAFIQPNVPITGDAEGFGLVLLEAASACRPVFASNLEGIPDAISDAKNGRLLPAGSSQAWIKTLGDWIASGEYKNKSQAVVARTYTLQTFSWPNVARQYQAALRRITDREQL